MSWYSAIVVDNADPDQRGRLRLRIPGLLGPDAIAPDWIPARVVGGAHGRAVGLWWCPPVDAIVLVEVDGPRIVWSGGEVSGSTKLPDALLDGYPRRAGLTSPKGNSAIVLDDQSPGLALLVPDSWRVLAGSLSAAIPVVREPELAAWMQAITTYIGAHVHSDPMTAVTGTPTTPTPDVPDVASDTLFVRG